MRHDTEGIRRAARKIGNSGQDLGGVVDALASALDAAGDCWGGDEAGQEFAKTYVPAADSSRSALKKLVEALGSVERNLEQTATDSEQRDRREAGNLGRLGG